MLSPGAVAEAMGDEDILLRDDAEGDPDVFGGGAGLVRSDALIRLKISEDAARPARLRHPPSRLFQSGPGHGAVEFPRPHHRTLHPPMARAAAPGQVIAADTAAARDEWLAWLRHERRGSPHTIAAYGRDLGAFLGFLTGHLGQPAALADLSALNRGDFRAWLAARDREGLTASSTARALSGCAASFASWPGAASRPTAPSACCVRRSCRARCRRR